MCAGVNLGCAMTHPGAVPTIPEFPIHHDAYETARISIKSKGFIPSAAGRATVSFSILDGHGRAAM
jgi:hypothetical protein